MVRAPQDHVKDDQARKGCLCARLSRCFSIYCNRSKPSQTVLIEFAIKSIAFALKVFGQLKEQPLEACRGSRHIHVWDQPICNKGFQKLFGVGKKRFFTLSFAARNGEEHPPYDGRYVKKGKKLQQTPIREKIHRFLLQLYEQVAEHLPDGINSNKRPRHAPKKFDSSGLDRKRIKHLPYGSISDYHRQCVATVGPVSRKLFCSDSGRLFSNFSFHLVDTNHVNTKETAKKHI